MKCLKKRFLWAVLIIVWVAIFILLNQIILFFTDQNLKPSYVDLQMNNSAVNYAIDEFTISDNLLNTVYIRGWAFIETEQENPEKTVKLIFVSDVNVYEREMTLSEKPGIENVLSGKKVPQHRNGISSRFSPIQMKNGIYTLYLYVYENMNYFGLINTGREFRKENDNFVEYYGGESLPYADFANAIPNKEVNWGIDLCEVRGDELVINGWAFMEDTDSSKNRIYIEIRKPDGTVSVYNTKRIIREDVGVFFKNSKYNLSGFSSHIPISDDILGQGENNITVIIGAENRAVREYVYIYNKDDK